MRLAPVEIDVIGIVVPARNEEVRLPRCLAALDPRAAAAAEREASLAARAAARRSISARSRAMRSSSSATDMA